MAVLAEKASNNYIVGFTITYCGIVDYCSFCKYEIPKYDCYVTVSTELYNKECHVLIIVDEQ